MACEPTRPEGMYVVWYMGLVQRARLVRRAGQANSGYPGDHACGVVQQIG